ARLAHVVLPACPYAEMGGTCTNLEGNVLRIRQAMEPIGESLPDWHIMTAMANGLGYALEYESPQDIQNEIMKLLPGYYNLGQPKKLSPRPDAYLSNGYAASVASRYRGADTRASDEHVRRPFVLTMGQLLYHSGKLSTQASGLIKLAPNAGRLSMNVEDMTRMGLVEGARVRVTSAKGSVELTVQPDLTLRPGSCFFPEHFNEPSVKDLMPLEVDADTGVPSFKFARVTIEKV
ncbi:MAG: molybdopterin oxidoreductase family protein, partial [Nitrospiraceae bacterium]